MSNHSTKHPIVQAIHTAVKGRARYKVNKLYRSESLKRFLEVKLSQKKGITQVCANHWTGNVLVIFDQNISLNLLASILKDLVLDYRQQNELSLAGISRPVVKQNVLFNERVNGYREILVTDGANGKDSLTGNSHNKVGSVLMMKMLLHKQLNQASNHLTWLWGAVGTLAVATGVLHYYGLDKGILLFIQKLHTPFFDRLMLGITFLGEPATLLLICLGLIMSPLGGSKRSEKATTLSIATVGAVGLNYWLKLRFGRVRPALWERIINVRHHSFPSGHAMMSIVTYGFIGYLLAKQFPQWREQIFALSFVLIVAIGFSRLYLGVHWPTDVLAGYAVGLVWLSACIISLELWQAYSKDSNGKLLTVNTSPNAKAIPSLSRVSECASVQAI